MNNKRLEVIKMEYFNNLVKIILENKHIIMKIIIYNEDFVELIIKNKKTNQNKKYKIKNYMMIQENTIPKKYLSIVNAQVIAYQLLN